MKLYVSEVLPCYTYDLYYMTYNKSLSYYEFGPIPALSKDEKSIFNQVTSHLENKGLTCFDKKFYLKKFKDLYSDTNHGNASLFDVLFTDIYSYQTEIHRFLSKQITEKSGTKFRWEEYYHENGALKERIESRWTSSGDYLKVSLDHKGQITCVEVNRKNIGGKKNQTFKLEIQAQKKSRKR